MTARQPILRQELRKPNRHPHILPQPGLWLALSLVAAGCTHPNDQRHLSNAIVPCQAAKNQSPNEPIRTQPPNPYAHLPGTYVDREGKRSLIIYPTPSGGFRFVISAQTTREVFYDAVLNPGLRVTQSATNNSAGVSESIILQDIQTTSVRLKRLDTPIPESVVYQKVSQ